LAGPGDVVLVVLARAGQTNSATTPDLFLPTSGDRPSYEAMVERRDGPSWLRDDDDDDDDYDDDDDNMIARISDLYCE